MVSWATGSSWLSLPCGECDIRESVSGKMFVDELRPSRLDSRTDTSVQGESRTGSLLSLLGLMFVLKLLLHLLGL